MVFNRETEQFHFNETLVNISTNTKFVVTNSSKMRKSFIVLPQRQQNLHTIVTYVT